MFGLYISNKMLVVCDHATTLAETMFAHYRKNCKVLYMTFRVNFDGNMAMPYYVTVAMGNKPSLFIATLDSKDDFVSVCSVDSKGHFVNPVLNQKELDLVDACVAELIAYTNELESKRLVG
jgi:hypothetical protein